MQLDSILLIDVKTIHNILLLIEVHALFWWKHIVTMPTID